MFPPSAEQVGAPVSATTQHEARPCNDRRPKQFGYNGNEQAHVMRGILLWALGIPIPVIILLYLFHVI